MRAGCAGNAADLPVEQQREADQEQDAPIFAGHQRATNSPTIAIASRATNTSAAA